MNHLEDAITKLEYNTRVTMSRECESRDELEMTLVIVRALLYRK
jgi:hypothetical protein